MDLQILNSNSLQILNDKHLELFNRVQKKYPIIEKATENFNKSQSQFMDNMLTISQLTPLRSARQCLAEIKKIKLAIEEAVFNIKKKQLLIKKSKYFMDKVESPFDKELLEIEVGENETNINNITDNINGAIRKMSGFITQYENILKKYGKESFTEEDFEKDEERYHIMKAFEQGLNAARARGGIIDEGNLIYLFQIGISGTAAQIEVREYLKMEDIVINNGGLPSHEMSVRWLESMADKYCGSALKFAEYKGVTLTDEQSLLIGE